MKFPFFERRIALVNVLARCLAAGMLAGSSASAALTLRYSFEGINPAVDPTVTNLGAGATVNGTIVNPEKTELLSGTIVSVGASNYDLGTSLRFISADAEEGGAGHIDSGLLPEDLGVTNGATWNRDYTMMAWVNFQSTIGDNMIFGQVSGGDALHNGSRNGSLHSGHWGDDIGPDQGVSVNSLPNSWHHVAFVNAGQTQSIYRDGVLVVGPGAPGANAANGLSNILISTSRNNGSFVGALDEVKIFGDQALTSDEIRAAMVAGLTPYTLATFTSASFSETSYTFTLTDSATSIIDNSKPKSLTIDGTAVTAAYSKSGPITTVTYTPAVVPEAGSPHTFVITMTDNNNTAVTGSGVVRAPWKSIMVGGHTWVTEHIYTRGLPQLNTAAETEAVLDDPSPFPAEDVITVNSRYIHFHDDVAPPIYGPLSRPYPLFDPANGGTGFGGRDDFGIRSSGQFNISKAGTVWFVCNSDDGFSLRIDGAEIGSAGNKGRSNIFVSTVLTAGAHDFEFVHWERGGGAGVSLFILKGTSETEPPFGEDSFELLEAWLNPADTDGDGMTDVYEVANGLNPAVNDAALDKDGDGLTNLVEFQRGTRADTADTDGDGLNDKVESGTGLYVSAADTGTNPLLKDTDGDGLSDKVETNTRIFVSGTDTGTNPFNKDSDSDGASDPAEVALGTDPNSATSVATVIAGGGQWATEHVWTRSNPQINDTAGAEAVLNDTSVFPVGDSIRIPTRWIHFHDNVAPPWFVTESKPYPLFDQANGGSGFGDRDDFALRSRGKIMITKAGIIWFNCNSDDGFSLRVDGVEIGNAGNRGRTDTVVSADLTVGLHDVELIHWERGGGAGVSVLVYRGPSVDQPAAVNDVTWQLLETTSPAAPSSSFAVTSLSYDQTSKILNLSFSSEAGSNYALEYTIGFQAAGGPPSPLKWNVVPGYNSIAGAAGTTAIAPLNTSTLVAPTGQLPDNSKAFFRIRKL